MEDQTTQNPIQEPIQVPEPVSAPVPVQTPNSEAKSPVIPFLLVILVLLLVSTGFLFYQNQQLKNQIFSLQTQPVVSPTPIAYSSPVPSATADPTASWKTFFDTKYNFSFKYPDKWTSTTCGLEDTLLLNPKSGNIECATEPQEPIQISVMSGTYQKVDDYIKSWEKGGFKATLESPNLPNGGLKYSIVKVGIAPGPEKFSKILVQLNNAILVIDINDPNQATTADQILSTFKFTK